MLSLSLFLACSMLFAPPSFAPAPHAAPEDLTARPLGPTSARVCWEPPPVALLTVRVVSFTVHYSEAEEKDVTARRKVLADKTCYDIVNLSPGTSYRVWVTSATPQGEGKPTKPVLFRTEQSGSVEKPRWRSKGLQGVQDVLTRGSFTVRLIHDETSTLLSNPQQIALP